MSLGQKCQSFQLEAKCGSPFDQPCQNLAIRCQAVDGRASNASTVWRQVATATGGYGDRWLRLVVAIRCQAVDGRASNASTVWRQVATATGGYGDRWLRLVVAIRCQAVDGRASNASTVWRQVATATGGYSDRWLRPENEKNAVAQGS
jgi:uncharacterized protein YjeT (DUF2065 family)